MKLSVIYNVFDGCELLKGSIACIKDHVDLIIIVYQTESNYGEQYDPIFEIHEAIGDLKSDKVILELYRPDTNAQGSRNELIKRNIGLEIAKKEGCTHFLTMDTDEYYKDFAQAKEEYLLSDAEGSVCELLTYFKTPTLRFENPDNYFVPFIHRLRTETVFTYASSYKYWCDPTRRPYMPGHADSNDIIKIKSERMHHFSYVRKDIQRKINNSSARTNILNTNIVSLHRDAKAGDYIEPFFKQTLIEVPNLFNINI